jgi:hypothetical protein
MEPCATYKPWHNKQTGKTYLVPEDGKCLHYYFYFIDKELGLCYVRVPTWCPFRLQFYCNGHNWLARQLDRNKIGYTLLDNAFTRIEDWAAAQKLADGWDASRLHRKLDEFAGRYCPILKQIEENVSLEPGRSRVRHRHRFPPADRSASHLWKPDPDRHPHGQAR